MLIAKDIRIYIIEDDEIQAEILRDKLSELNKGTPIKVFTNEDELYTDFDKNLSSKNFNIVILDYFLQNEKNTNTSNADTIVQILKEKYPSTSIIIYSAYESDNKLDFNAFTEDNDNVISFVKKSEHGYLGIQNLLRFNYIGWQLKRRTRQLKKASLIFATIAIAATIYFTLASL